MEKAMTQKVKGIYNEVKEKRTCLISGSWLYMVLVAGEMYGHRAYEREQLPDLTEDNTRISQQFDAVIDELSEETEKLLNQLQHIDLENKFKERIQALLVSFPRWNTNLDVKQEKERLLEKVRVAQKVAKGHWEQEFFKELQEKLQLMDSISSQVQYIALGYENDEELVKTMDPDGREVILPKGGIPIKGALYTALPQTERAWHGYWFATRKALLPTYGARLAFKDEGKIYTWYDQYGNAV